MVHAVSFVRHRIAFATLLLAGLVAGCEGTETGIGPENLSVDDFIGAVAVVGSVEASLDTNAAPSAANGPVVTANASAGFITGGTSLVVVTSPTPFQSAIVRVGGAKGFFRVDLPAPVTSVTLEVSIVQQPRGRSFDIMYAGIATSGAVGVYTSNRVQVVQVGTGPVQVSLSWNSAADVDLYLVQPDGQEIYYGQRTSSQGGELDLDSNAGCGVDEIRNENITYPTGTPPSGTYTVRVNYWSNCGAAATSYVVTVYVEGQGVRTFSGSYTGAGVGGGAGAGQIITTFTR